MKASPGRGQAADHGEPADDVRSDVRVHRGVWLEHRRRAGLSLDVSRRLGELGFTDPAFVWAVRAVEIFVRECLLLPLYYEETGDLDTAYKKAHKIFGSGNWTGVIDTATKFYGPFDQPLTDTDEDAWAHWKRAAVSGRGEVVHGYSSVSREEVEWVQSYADRFMSWWAQRLFVADRGPMRGLLTELAERLRAGHRVGVTDENVTAVGQDELVAQDEAAIDSPARETGGETGY